LAEKYARPAAKLDDAKAADVTEQAKLLLGTLKMPG